MKKLIPFLMLISLLFVWTVSGATAESQSAANDGTVSYRLRASSSNDDKDEEKEDKENEDKEDDKDDDKVDDKEEDEEDEDEDDENSAGGKYPASRYSALNYHGTLSSYKPAREDDFGMSWGKIVVEQEGDDDEKEPEPDYEATYEDGRLKELEIEIELKDGTEYEVVFDRNKKILRAEYETDDGEIYFDGSAWHDADGNEVEGPDLSFTKKYFNNYKLKGIWYENNTVSLVGLSLRDMYPQLTDKWYQVVPIDLTQDGVYRYPLAAGNMYYMGSCIVTVKGDSVTTDYTLPRGHVAPDSDCLMWFTDISDISTEFLEAPVGAYQFGQPVSISGDLKGQKTALLFICNHVTFRIPLTSGGGMPSKYYRGNQKVRSMLRGFEQLFAQMQNK